MIFPIPLIGASWDSIVKASLGTLLLYQHRAMIRRYPNGVELDTVEASVRIARFPIDFDDPAGNDFVDEKRGE